MGQRLLNLIKAIFGSQPNGTLAGDGVVKAVAMNCLLFISLGYLLLLWIPALRQNKRGRVVAVIITVAVSLVIECVQELTGLGKVDWKDVLSNSLGGAIGVVIVNVFEQRLAGR